MSSEKNISITIRLTAEENEKLTQLAGGKPVSTTVREVALAVAQQALTHGLTPDELANAVIVSPDTRILTVGVSPSVSVSEAV